MANSKNNNPVLFDLYDQETHIAESRTVFDGCIDMGGLPDSYIGVTVTDANNNRLVEIFDGKAPKQGEFRVDYKHGWLYVDPKVYNKQTLTLDFHSRGLELTPLTRIYTFDANGCIDLNRTLQRYIDEVNGHCKFDIADKFENLETGDSFNTMFGKLAKWYEVYNSKINDLYDTKADKKNEDGGFQGGSQAFSTGGGAIGFSSSSDDGGAVGKDSTTHFGGAIGLISQSVDGFAGGCDTRTEDGSAIGSGASSNNGGSVGANTKTDDGGAVGFSAISNNGFAGGYDAKANDGGAVGNDAKAGDGFSGGDGAQVGTTSSGKCIDAIQLGTGTNNNPKTLQVYDYQVTKYDNTNDKIYLKDVGNLSHLPTISKTDIVNSIIEINNKFTPNTIATMNTPITISNSNPFEINSFGQWIVQFSIPSITIQDTIWGTIVLPTTILECAGVDGDNKDYCYIRYEFNTSNPSGVLQESDVSVDDVYKGLDDKHDSYIEINNAGNIESVNIYIGEITIQSQLNNNNEADYTGYVTINDKTMFSLIRSISETNSLEAQILNLIHRITLLEQKVNENISTDALTQGDDPVVFDNGDATN